MRKPSFDQSEMDADTIKRVIRFVKGKLSDDDLRELEELMNGNADFATPASLAGIRELQEAQTATRGVLGAHDSMAFDSAGKTYKAALRVMGVDTAGISNGAALRQIFDATRRARRSRGVPLVPMAMDSAAASDLARRYPHAAKIKNNVGFM